MTIEEVLDKTVAIVTTYEGLAEDFSSPYFVQELRDKLAAYSIHIGSIEASLRRDYNGAEYMYKSAKLTNRLVNRKKGMSIADAEAEAELAVNKEHDDYIAAEEIFFRVRNLREQVNKVLDSMSSRLRIIMENGTT